MPNRFVASAPSKLNYHDYYAILNDGEDINTVVENEAPKDCASGSTLYFINTGDVFMYYSPNQTWYRQ